MTRPDFPKETEDLTSPMEEIEEAVDQLITLAGSPPNHLDAAYRWLQEGNLSLSLHDCAKDFRDRSRAVGISLEDAEKILDAFFDLETLRRVLDWGHEALLDVLLGSVSKPKGHPLSDKASVERVKTLFSCQDRLDMLYKALLVYEGITPNYVSCRSLCEVRPVFDSSRKKILSSVITSTLIIAVRDRSDKSKSEDLVFQLDLNDIKDLKAELANIINKLEAMYVMYGKRRDGSSNIMNP